MANEQAEPISTHPIKKGKLADLVPDARNANRGTPRGNQMIESSLRQYGAGRSVLADKHGRLIAGNKMVENAGAIGLDDTIVVQTTGQQVVVVQRMDLDLSTDVAAKELAIADNRAAQVSLDWDPDVLKGLAEDIDLGSFFTDDELAALLPTVVPAELTGDEDAVPDVPTEAKTKIGDLYVLGDHRLLCGDSTSITDVERLMASDLANLIVTDPPYNVAIVGGNHSLSPEQRKVAGGKVIDNDNMGDEDFYQFLYDAHTNMFTVAAAGCGLYVFHADSEGLNFRRAFKDSGFKLAQCCIWVKQSLVMGRQDYHWQHEPILYGWKEGAAHSWHADRKQTTVWNFNRPSRSGEHPTMKPVALVEYPITNSSKQGDVVLDLFGGSGTTMIACEKLGRKARLMEIDPAYCDVIVKRWEDATGKKAALFSVEN